eukprot:SAG11_NODE_661_length_7885_cov_8.956974_8_plen_120_part_00
MLSLQADAAKLAAAERALLQAEAAAVAGSADVAESTRGEEADGAHRDEQLLALVTVEGEKGMDGKKLRKLQKAQAKATKAGRKRARLEKKGADQNFALALTLAGPAPPPTKAQLEDLAL